MKRASTIAELRKNAIAAACVLASIMFVAWIVMALT